MVTNSSTVSHAEGLYVADVAGDVVIMSVSGGECVGLNVTGAFLWRKLEEPTSVSALIGHACEQFAGSKEDIAQDVLELLVDLERRGLVLASDRQ